MKRPTTIRADGSDRWSNSHGILTTAADNVLCSRLSSAFHEASLMTAGDSIDRGLTLILALKQQGFGLVYQGEPPRKRPTAGVAASDQHTPGTDPSGSAG